jgi:hypothetical protein
VGEVRPGGVAGHEGAAQDFAGVIVEGEDEGGIMVGGPPRVRGGVMLPEFADGRALPAAAGLGATFERGPPLGKVLAHVSGDGGRGAGEVKLAGQLVRQEREVERLAVGQDAGQEIMGGGWPGCFMIAAGRLGGESGFVAQPVVAEAVELGGTDVQPLRGGQCVELTCVEGGQDFLDIEGRNAMGQLGLFILGPSVSARSAEGQGGRSFSL